MAREAALRFAAEGAAVVGCDINPETAGETLSLVRAAGGRMESLHPVDLTSEDDAHRLMEFAVERFGGIDVLYNSAMAIRLGTFERFPVDEFRFTLEHVLTLQWVVTKHAIPHLRKRGGGSIVFIGSVAGLNLASGFIGNLSWGFAYAVAKAGVIRMALSLANELSTLGIRVNVVSPGMTLTRQGMPSFGEEGTRLRHMWDRQTLMGRAAVPAEIVNAALFLASDEASYITGQNLCVDGGYAASGSFGPPAADCAEEMWPAVGEFISADPERESSGIGPAASEWPTIGAPHRGVR
jgi:NAD(P)-dependent dehydrogenase (short-subunit alcohol dehydrogenase family)